MSKNILMDVMHQAIDALFGIQRREERNAVLTIDDDVILAAEPEHIIHECPEIHEVKSTSPDDPYAIHRFAARRMPVVAAENRHLTPILHPLARQLFDIRFRSARERMPHISPVEYENALGRNRSLRSSRELSRKDSEQILECSPDKTHFFPGKMQRLDQYPSDRAGEENHIDDALEGLVAQDDARSHQQ